MQHTFSHELTFKTSRSGGKGGQNVNKVETAVEALWVPAASQVFSPAQIEQITRKLAGKINANGQLTMRSQVHRSQLANKADVEKKMYRLVNDALKTHRPRIATRPTKSGVESRLRQKNLMSELKANRRKRIWNSSN
jgi:ribosome-associated protein